VKNWKGYKLKKPLVCPSIFLEGLRKLQNGLIRIASVQIDTWDILNVKQKFKSSCQAVVCFNTEYGDRPRNKESTGISRFRLAASFVDHSGKQWVMCCPGGKSCHIPAVLILSEAEILNTVHVTLPCNVHHKTQVFFGCIMQNSSMVRLATTA
jgi:hypothetical protein